MSVPWHIVAEALGRPETKRVLPLTTECPFCHGQRFSLYDSVSAGEWGYCFDCLWTGDTIEAAAKAWNLPVTATVRRLHAEGAAIPERALTDVSIDQYAGNIASHRIRLRKVWAQAQQYIVNQPTRTNLAALRYKLDLVSSLSPDRMAAGPAKIFGASNIKLLAAAFNTRPRDCLPGRGWEDVIVIPFWQAPGLLAGLYVVGRQGGPGDHRYLAVHTRRGPDIREGGLAGLLPALSGSEGVIVGISDPVMLASMQLRHFNSSLQPLPLVAWQHGAGRETAIAWQAIQNRTLTLWEPWLTADVLLQCYRLDCRLAIGGPATEADDSVSSWLRKWQPADLIKRILSQARPWREAVRNWLQRTPAGTTKAILQELENDGHDSLMIMREASPKNPLWEQKKLAIRTVKLANTTYLERNSRWFIRRNSGKEYPFLNAILRIDGVVTRKTRTENVGRLLLPDGREIPFRAENVSVQFIKKLASDNDFTLECIRGRAVIDVATAFHQPKHYKGKRLIGWDGTGFRFKHFSLVDGKMQLHPPAYFPIDCPGPQIAQFKLGPAICRELGTIGENQEVAWAIITSVLANIMAPICKQPQPGILISGRLIDAPAVAVLDKIGIPSKMMKINHRGGTTQVRFSVRWPHRWPLRVKANWGKRVHVYDWMLREGFPWLVCIRDSLTTLAATACGGFILVYHSGELNLALLNDIPWEHAFMGYLRYVSGKPPAVSKDMSWWENVHQSLMAYLKSENIDTTSAAAAKRWICTVDDKDMLHRLAGQLYADGFLRVVGSRHSGNKATIVSFDDRGLIVTKEQLATALTKARVRMPALLEQMTEPLVVSRRYLQ